MTVERETSIRRGVEILLVLGGQESLAQGGLSVTRIAELIDRDKSQVSRALQALGDYGLVERANGRTFRLGWRIYTLARGAGEPRLLELAVPALERLVDRTNERAYVTVLQGVEVLTVLAESADRAIQAVGWAGRVTPVTCTASGRALLFDHTRDQLEALLARERPTRRTARTVCDAAGVWQRLEAARHLGYAVVDEEFEEELLAIAAPVRDGTGRIIAAVNVGAPRWRILDRVEELGQRVRGVADELGQAVGAEPELTAVGGEGGHSGGS